MREIINKGGFAIYEENNVAYFVDFKVGLFYTLSFILLLITSLLLIISFAFFGFNLKFGLILFMVSIFFGFFSYKSIKYLQKKTTVDFIRSNITIMIDFDKKKLLNSQGKVLSNLKNISFYKGFQISSSASSLNVRWGESQKMKIFKFNGLIGGEKLFINYLKQKEIWKNK